MAVTISARGTSFKSFKIGKKGTTLFQGNTDPAQTETVVTGDLWLDTGTASIRSWTGSNWKLISFDNIAISGNEIAATGNLDLTATGIITLNGEEALTSTSTTDDVNEGLTNLYYTDTRSRQALSATSTGIGTLSYNNTTGEFSYTGPTEIQLGAETSGTYVSSLIEGAGITLTNASGESATPTVAVDSTVVRTSGDQTISNVKTFTDARATQDPTQDLQLATKQYVDSVASGLDAKASVKVTTTANIALNDTTTTIDGVTLNNGDRILVKDQTDQTENGIYVYSDSGAWSRSADADGTPASEVSSGLFTFVEQGTTYSSTGWTLATADPISLGTTNLDFVQFSSSDTFTAGDGLARTGSVLDVTIADGLQFIGSNVAVDDTVLRTTGDQTKTGDLTVDSTGDIAGTTWDNGWFKVANSGAGWSMDPNELYANVDATVGSLTGNITLNSLAGATTVSGSTSTTIESTSGNIVLDSSSDTVYEQNSTEYFRSTTGTSRYVDSHALALGTDSDLKIYHTGTDGYVQNETGTLFIQNTQPVDSLIELGVHSVADVYYPTIRLDGEATSARALLFGGQGSQQAQTGAGFFRVDNQLQIANANNLMYEETDNLVVEKLGAANKTQFKIDSTVQAEITNSGIQTANQVRAGVNDGTVALSTNDSYSQSSISFNHTNGIVDQTGNAARISVNTNNASNPVLAFQLGSGTAGNGQVLANALRLKPTKVIAETDLHIGGEDNLVVSASTNNAMRINSDFGFVTIGPQNGSEMNFVTDKDSYVFDKSVDTSSQGFVTNLITKGDSDTELLFENIGGTGLNDDFNQGIHIGSTDVIDDNGSTATPRFGMHWSYPTLTNPTDVTFKMGPGNLTGTGVAGNFELSASNGGTVQLASATQATDGLTVTRAGSPSIAGTTWDNGWLKIGTDTQGWSIDGDEIYAANGGVIGSIAGNFNVSAASSLNLGGGANVIINPQTQLLLQIGAQSQMNADATRMLFQDDYALRFGAGSDLRLSHESATGQSNIDSYNGNLAIRALSSGNAVVVQAEDTNGTRQNVFGTASDANGTWTNLNANNVTEARTVNGGFRVNNILEIADSGNTVFEQSDTWRFDKDSGAIQFNTDGNRRVRINSNGIIADDYIQAGTGTGGVALTHNDGYGNANVTFNHVAGQAEQDGNSGRIDVNTDDVTDPQMRFAVGSLTVADGPTSITDRFIVSSTGTETIGTHTTRQLRVESSTPNIIIQDTDNTGVASTGEIAFQDQAGTITGRVGLIDNTTGDVQVRSNSGAVELVHSGSAKLITSSAGATTVGTHVATSFTHTGFITNTSFNDTGDAGYIIGTNTGDGGRFYIAPRADGDADYRFTDEFAWSVNNGWEFETGLQVGNWDIDASTVYNSSTATVGTTAGNLILDGAGDVVVKSNNAVTFTDQSDVAFFTANPTGVTIAGNLTVNGTTTTVNTQTLDIADNIITLNSDVTGAPTENAGIEVERGTGANVSIRWNETSDEWEFTNDGTTFDPLGQPSGSINADTLDGLTSSQFLRADASDTFVGPLEGPTLVATSRVVTDQIDNRTGSQLVLNAGESAGFATGQTGERVYLNAENGVEINASPNNWSGTGWSQRVTTTIDDTGIIWDGNTVWHDGYNGFDRFVQREKGFSVTNTLNQETVHSLYLGVIGEGRHNFTFVTRGNSAYNSATYEVTLDFDVTGIDDQDRHEGVYVHKKDVSNGGSEFGSIHSVKLGPALAALYLKYTSPNSGTSFTQTVDYVAQSVAPIPQAFLNPTETETWTVLDSTALASDTNIHNPRTIFSERANQFTQSYVDNNFDGNVLVNEQLTVNGSTAGTIAGTTFDNGWLKIGTDTLGWAFDDNEIYNSSTGIIGSIAGDLDFRTPNGAIDMLTQGDIIMRAGGLVKIQDGAVPELAIVDSAQSGTDSQGEISFRDSNNSKTARIGMLNSPGNELYIRSGLGGVRLEHQNNLKFRTLTTGSQTFGDHSADQLYAENDIFMRGYLTTGKAGINITSDTSDGGTVSFVPRSNTGGAFEAGEALEWSHNNGWTFNSGPTILGSGSIAGTTWDNGWLKIGTSTVGWSIDENEIYNSDTGTIGTLSGNLILNPSNALVMTGSNFNLNEGELNIHTDGADALSLRPQTANFSIGMRFRDSSNLSQWGIYTNTGNGEFRVSAYTDAGAFDEDVIRITKGDGVSKSMTLRSSLNTDSFIQSDSYVQAGADSTGPVALTTNDGQGNANVTFNHRDGVPGQVGVAGRIVVDTDNTSANGSGSMVFQLNDVTTTAFQSLTTRFKITENGTETTGDHVINGDLTLVDADPVINIQDNNNTGAGAIGSVKFRDSANSVVGEMGNLATGNSDIYLRANSGAVRLDHGTSTKFITRSTGTETFGTHTSDSVSSGQYVLYGFNTTGSAGFAIGSSSGDGGSFYIAPRANGDTDYRFDSELRWSVNDGWAFEDALTVKAPPGTPTIGGANWDNGWFKIGTSAGGGWSFDNNEFYNSTAALMGTLVGDLTVQALSGNARFSSTSTTDIKGNLVRLLDSSNSVILSGNSSGVTIAGDLTVNGTTTTINTQTLNVSDNIVVLNNDVTGAPTENAGIEVERGTSANVSILWNETSNQWEFTNDGSTFNPLGQPSGNIDATTLGGLTSSQFLRSDATDLTTNQLTVQGNFIADNRILTTRIDSNNGQQIVLNAGESSNAKAQAGVSQTSEYVYVNAENGLEVNASTDNWSGGAGAWANRVTTVINSAGITWDGNTVWHAGNDGAGTGLNADLVDGLQASQFLRSDTDDISIGNKEFRTNDTTGNYGLAAIEMRERGAIGSSITADADAPAIGWHWSGRIQGRLWFQSGSGGNRELSFTNGEAPFDTTNYSIRTGLLKADALLTEIGNNPGIDTFEPAGIWQARITNTDTGTAPVDFSHIVNLGGSSGLGYGTQLASTYGGDDDGFYIRRRSDNAASENGANAWQDWKILLLSDGSTIDARGDNILNVNQLTASSVAMSTGTPTFILNDTDATTTTQQQGRIFFQRSGSTSAQIGILSNTNDSLTIEHNDGDVRIDSNDQIFISRNNSNKITVSDTNIVNSVTSYVINSNPQFRLRDNSATNATAQTGQLLFEQSDFTTNADVGFYTSSNDIFRIRNTAGRIDMDGAGSVRLRDSGQEVAIFANTGISLLQSATITDNTATIFNINKTNSGGESRITFTNTADNHRGQMRFNWAEQTNGAFEVWTPTNAANGQTKSFEVGADSIKMYEPVDLIDNTLTTAGPITARNIVLTRPADGDSDAGDMLSWINGGLKKITNGGGFLLYADGPAIIHAGDQRNSITPATGLNIPETATFENAYVTADNNVFIMTDMQEGVNTRHTWVFNSAGDLTCPGVVNATSDIRFKTNVKDYDVMTNAESIRSVSFNWTRDSEGTPVVGYIAQEVNKVLPDAVDKSDPDKWAVNYDMIHTAKIAELEDTVKEQQETIDDLQSQIDKLSDMVYRMMNK